MIEGIEWFTLNTTSIYNDDEARFDTYFTMNGYENTQSSFNLIDQDVEKYFSILGSDRSTDCGRALKFHTNSGFIMNT